MVIQHRDRTLQEVLAGRVPDPGAIQGIFCQHALVVNAHALRHDVIGHDRQHRGTLAGKRNIWDVVLEELAELAGGRDRNNPDVRIDGPREWASGRFREALSGRLIASEAAQNLCRLARHFL